MSRRPMRWRRAAAWALALSAGASACTLDAAGTQVGPASDASAPDANAASCDAGVGGGVPEICNGLDDDCDGQVDEGDDPGGSACPCQREERDGSTYQFCPEKLGWGIAVARCAARGYHLVKIDDDPENDWLYARGESALQSEPWWAGLSDIAAEGTWVWVDLAPVAYQKWDLGSDEPNGGTEENCLDLSHHGDGWWNDADCALVQPFVCELGPP